MIPIRRAASLLVLLVPLTFAGCANSDTRAGGPTPDPTRHVRPHASGHPRVPGATARPDPPREPPSDVVPGQPTGSDAPPPCAADDLQVSLVPGDSAAGTTALQIVIHNTGGTLCETGGYGGVSYVADGSGPPVGAPAVRVERADEVPIGLGPGGDMVAQLEQIDVANLPANRCRPTDVSGPAGLPTRPDRVGRSREVGTGLPQCGRQAAEALALPHLVSPVSRLLSRHLPVLVVRCPRGPAPTSSSPDARSAAVSPIRGADLWWRHWHIWVRARGSTGADPPIERTRP